MVISGPLSVAASTEKRILVVRIGSTQVRRYDIAVGKKAHPTPMGRFTTAITGAGSSAGRSGAPRPATSAGSSRMVN